MSAGTAILLSILMPIAAVPGIAIASRRPNLREFVSLAAAVALTACVWSLLPGVMAGHRPALELFTFVHGLSIRFAVEPLGAVFAALASLLWFVTTVYSIGYMRGNAERNQTRYYAFFAVAIASTMGVALAGNLLTLFLFYEALTLSTYPLVAHHGDDRARSGARSYLFILLATSIGLLLPAIAWTWFAAGTLEFTPGGILEGRIAGVLAAILLLLYVLGIGKAAVMPVHRWLPAAMVAPTPVSALLHAVAVVKAGVFAVAKVVIYVFGVDFLVGVPAERLLVWLAGFTVIAASVVALRQTDLKRLLAYSTVSQLSYVVLAALVLSPLASGIGATVHIVAHAFGKITLFFAAGAIYVAARKRDIRQLAGIGRRMPWTMAAFTVGAVSMVGVPPTAGFVSKWYILSGALQLDDTFVLTVLVLSTGLSAAYFLPIVWRAYFREEEAPAGQYGEAPWPMVAALTATAALTLAFFACHGPVVELASGIPVSRP